jgi:hypothetical protein
MTVQDPASGCNFDLPAVRRRSARSDPHALLAVAAPIQACPESPIRQFFGEWFGLERATYGAPTQVENVFEAAAAAMADLEEQIRRQPPTSIEDVPLKVVVLTCFGEYCLTPDFHNEFAELMASRMSASATPV